MKAIRIHEFGGPEVMRLEDVPDPEPRAGEVVVQVRAAGVNPVDTYLRSGTYRPDLKLPWTPGMDAAGIIEAVGEGVSHRKVGDRVYVARRGASGTYAEKVRCREFDTHPLPERVSFQQGAAIGVPFGAAFRSLFQRGRGVAGETVLVHGASGGMGTAAVQLARAAGMRVIGTAGTSEGIEIVKSHGAHHVLNHRDEGYLDRIPELTCGQGIDLVIEALANVNLGKDLKIVAKGGRIVIVGSRGTVEVDPRDAMAREAEILGMILFNADEFEYRSMHAAFVAGLGNGTLDPAIGREFPLEAAPEAHRTQMEEPARGKIVLIPQG